MLVTLDTVRADHLGSYGYPRGTTPFLDELASEGVRFTRAFTPSPHTAPAHASILTSLLPQQHRVLVNGPPLDDRIPTLSSLLGAHGYQTGAFVSVAFLEQIAGSFGVVSQAVSQGAIHRRAEETVDAALAWLGDVDEETPWFLWVHLFDAHEHAFEPSVPAATLARLREGSAAMIRDRKRALSERFGYPPDQVDLHFDLYDAQIGYQDAQLRRLFEALRERGEERRTLWVVTADHGEGMGDHGYWGHGTRVYDEQVRVPLIFFGGRGRWPAGVAEGLTRHVDLLPTLAELLGVSLDLDALRIEGSSVARWLDDPGARLPARIVLSETRPLGKYRRAIGQRDAMRISARDARYKYIHNEGRPDEFYDLESDPGELSDLVRQPSARRDRLRTWLFSRWAQLGEDARSDDSRLDLSVEQIELLEKLGYL